MTETNSCSTSKFATDDLTPAIREYLSFYGTSRNIVKYMCDQINETESSPDNEPLRDNETSDTLNRSISNYDGRAPSPSSVSSVASGRRLEWDSGADVGYQPSTSVHPTSLSTLERMALGGCAESLIRTDPEGKSSCSGNSINRIHNSAIVSLSGNTTDAKIVYSTKTVTSPREVCGFVNSTIYTNNEAVGVKSVCKDQDELVKISDTSLSVDNELCINSTFQRESNPTCQNALEGLLNEHERKNSSEEAGITPLASAIHTNSASSSSLASTIITHKPDSMSSKSKMNKKKVTRGVQVGGTLVKCDYTNTNDVAPSLYKNECSEQENKCLCIANSIGVNSKEVEITKSALLDSMDTSSFDYANSFEYFPGDRCEPYASRKNSTEDSELHIDKPTRMKSSLSKDLEENIARVRDILNKNNVGNDERRILIKQLVERIIESEYCDDLEAKSSSKRSTDSSAKSMQDATSRSETPSKSKKKQSLDVMDGKLSVRKTYVPYRPIPGGRIYHIAGAKLEKGPENSTSSSEKSESRNITCYLPMDRVKITQQTSSLSETIEDSSECSPRNHKKSSTSSSKNVERTQKQDWIKSESQVTEDRNAKPSDEMHEKHKNCFSKQRQTTSGNWWSPATKSERKRLRQVTKGKINPLLTYMEHERSNQLHWIKNEINHLSNLAQLLEECAITKSEASASYEEQTSLFSSLRQYRKISRRKESDADKLLSSERSSTPEEPITATLRSNQGLSKQTILRDSCWGSNHSPSMERSSAQSTVESHSIPSRTSTRNRTNSDTSYALNYDGQKSSNKQSEAYMITFETVSPEKKIEDQNLVTSRKPLKEVRLKIPGRKGRSIAEEVTEKQLFSSLQEQLKAHHPSFIKTSEERKKCLEELAQLRYLRQMTRRKLLQFSLSNQEKLCNEEDKKISKSKTVNVKVAGKPKENIHFQNKSTKRKHRIPHEMQKKEADCIKKQNYQTNRMMADIFSRRLQRKVLSGAVTLSNSTSIISSL